ncbi:hypothetical protein D4R42_04005 [bacterium]|nr:MAG: hypothetical protein D4R42_04005 [bacterium]
MNKSDKEDICMLGVIKLLNGIATSSQIKQKVEELGYNLNTRKVLRRLKRQGVLKTDRPDSDKLEIRWEYAK